jgi:hypothetical protein
MLGIADQPSASLTSDTFPDDNFLLDDFELQQNQAWEDFLGGQSSRQLFAEPTPARTPVDRQYNLLVSSQPLAEKLINEAVCFGEGPRFFQENIDKAAFNFLCGIGNYEGMLAIPV